MIPVFYRQEMAVHTASFSPSSAKPAAVVADWFDRWPDLLRIRGFEPATLPDLTRAHSEEYVLGVMTGRQPNGFSNTDANVAHSLPYTVGSMLAAARWVSEGETVSGRPSGRVAVSPTSGFHHAHRDHAAGYCTFNGLAVAALDLVHSGRAKNVAILDCDFHEGDGTQDILDHLGVGPNLVLNCSAGAAHLQSSSDFKTWLNRALRQVREYDVVLYQAGADMCLLDPLGGLLTPRQMFDRDCMVFRAQAMYRFGLVWNLAGGYQRDERGTINPVLDLHRNTMTACLAQGEVAWSDR